MTIWIISILYFLIGCIVWRMAAGALAWTMLEGDKRRYSHSYGEDSVPDMAQWFCGIALGLIAGTFWPFALLFMFRFPWSIGPEARARMRAQEKYIRELERNLDDH